MNHLKKFNEGKEETANVMLKVLEKLLGVKVSEDGIMTCSNRFGRLICDLGVREGKFEKIETNKYKAKE